jgi:hypothetical protein
MRRAFAIACLCSAFALPGEGAESAAPDPAAPAPKLECLKAAETRDAVKQHHLLEPYVVLKTAGRDSKAEPLSAKLCRMDDDWVYSIAMLHKDGRYTHLLLDAVTGKVEANHGRETAK